MMRSQPSAVAVEEAIAKTAATAIMERMVLERFLWDLFVFVTKDETCDSITQ
jgi:hypothetical protein